MCDSGPMTTALLDERRLSAATTKWETACGKRLRDRRQALQLSQGALAAAIDKTVQSVSRYELGIASPPDSTRLAIACALVCEVNDIWPPMTSEYVLAVARAEVAA